ncbi:hypothetical protein, partial [uncultured Phyllobacterium sp.]|uniref:hypothetical protein n=1 Tax=uncultured Phyllobacterium sp. TaxID=253813 RepID=UPI002590397A
MTVTEEEQLEKFGPDESINDIIVYGGAKVEGQIRNGTVDNRGGSVLMPGTLVLSGDKAKATGTIDVGPGNAWLSVKFGATANEVIVDGTKAETKDQERSGGLVDVAGEKSRIETGIVKQGGLLSVSNSATAGTVTVNNGGKLEVNTGGKADDVTVNGVTGWKRTTVGVGGSAFVSGKGSEIKTGTVNNGGLLKVADGGTVGNVAVKTGGKLDVQAEGKVDNVVVEGEANYKKGIGWICGLGGYADVFGQISKSTVSKGGWLTVLSGGKIDDVIASAGGRVVVEAGGKVTNVTIDAGIGIIKGEITGKSTINSGSVLSVNPGGIAGEIVLNGGDSDAGIDKAGAAVAGTAGDITINRNGVLNGIGTVGNVFVHAGGTINSGASNDPTVKSAAENNLVGTLKATGDVTFDKGSFLGMQIANDGSNNSKLAVKGQANLLGGIVNVRSEDKDKTTGSATMLSEEQVKDFFRKSFVILTAVKGVKGKFDDIVPHYNYITPSLSYTDNEVRVGFDFTETAKAEKQKQLEAERAKVEEKRVADAKAEEKRVADAKAEEKRVADAKAEEKRVADAKAEEEEAAEAKAEETGAAEAKVGGKRGAVEKVEEKGEGEEKAEL